MTRKRYVDEDGVLECPGTPAHDMHACHISNFYDQGGKVWWTDPHSGKEYGRPSARCRTHTVLMQRAYNAQRRREANVDAEVEAAQRLTDLKARTWHPADDPDWWPSDEDIAAATD